LVRAFGQTGRINPMWHQCITYLKWLPKTVHLHGIHSPFVFKLQKQCLKDTTPFEAYTQLTNYRNELLKSKTVLTIEDHGAGSRVFKSNIRTVSDLAKKAGASKRRSQLLFRLVQYLKPKHILELGTSIGLGTHALSLGYPASKITSIEGAPEIAAFTQEQLASLSNIQIIQSTFKYFLNTLDDVNYDLIYIDGHHERQATLDYFTTLIAHSNENTLFLLDDIHWSKGMSSAWSTIKQLPEVTVTIDCFWFGLILLRKEQVKQDFYIRL